MFLKKDQHSSDGTKRLAAIHSLDSRFDTFLYAPIGESNNEMPISVLSVLARQNTDPWVEAAELARLPRATAIAKLTALISSVPAGTSGKQDPAGTAARLVALLPHTAVFNITQSTALANLVPQTFPPLLLYLIVGAVIAAALLVGS